ncbi:MAG: hypothetical protein LUC43_07725, partial [Burkholderiales bacterium]|nr:hypothetical protein [Burkholderiales bacterium]
IKRIHDIFTEGRRAVDVITSLGPLVSDLLNREVEENSDFISEAAKAFASNPHALALLHTDENFKKGLENLAIQEKEYRDKIKKLAETYNKDKIERENEIKELAGTKKVAKLNEDIKNLTEELKKFEKDLNEQEVDIITLRADLQDAESQLEGFEKRLDETVGKVASLAFEGSITAKIMEAADQWRAQKADSTYKSRVSALRNLQKRSDSGKSLNDELCGVLHSIRKYGHNEYVNLFVCLAQSFLTVLAGSPGSGKTSLCNYVARMFGLTSLKDQNGIGELWSDHPNYANRYIPISVERGWTSKRDLIGYFNPLSRTFESVDPHRFECFKQLDYEAKEKFEELPYFLLLDEANLSPMEYYFADFMNICDIRNDLSFVSIGGDSRFQIPDSLRFLATINNDHTTEMLSPRLVDRTWIILLPETEDLDIPEQEANKKLDNCGIIDWNLFRKTYAPRSKTNSPIQEDLKNISHRLSSLGLVLSPRTRTAIANYVSAAQSYMKKEGTRAPYKIALDYAVAQKILPMINGSGNSYKNSLDTLEEFLKTEKLTKSASALEQVIRKGTDTMDFYRFF